MARVPNVARDNIESGTPALAIFHKQATMQFYVLLYSLLLQNRTKISLSPIFTVFARLS